MYLLREARTELICDLRQFYGVRLSDMYAGVEHPFEVAAYAARIQRGGALAEWIGGWGAITGEEETLRRIEWLTMAVNSKKKPPLPKPPGSVRDAEIAARRKREVRERVRAMSKRWR